MIEYEGKWLRVIKRNGWEFVERTNITGIVAIIPVTKDGNIILIKQYREPLQKTVIEVPAGLVGDVDNKESIKTAAQRELLEETGYHANCLEELGTFPVSPGLCTEQLTYVIATDLEKLTEQVGVGDEQIEVFEIPIPTAVSYLLDQAKHPDILVDAKIFSAIMFAAAVVATQMKKNLKSK